jgi:hypothetical protein
LGEGSTGELKRWERILTAVHGMTNPGTCEVAKLALMLRGVLGDAARLAVSTVADAEEQRGRVSVEQQGIAPVLGLRGVFVVPELAEQGLVRSLGFGGVRQVVLGGGDRHGVVVAK